MTDFQPGSNNSIMGGGDVIQNRQKRGNKITNLRKIIGGRQKDANFDGVISLGVPGVHTSLADSNRV